VTVEPSRCLSALVRSTESTSMSIAPRFIDVFCPTVTSARAGCGSAASAAAAKAVDVGIPQVPLRMLMLAVSPCREWDVAFCSRRATFSAFAWRVPTPVFWSRGCGAPAHEPGGSRASGGVGSPL
jgi:hypothetical protein